MSARENILQKIKQALEKPVPVPFDRTIESEKVFVQGAEDDAVLFAQEFTKLQRTVQPPCSIICRKGFHQYLLLR